MVLIYTYIYSRCGRYSDGELEDQKGCCHQQRNQPRTTAKSLLVFIDAMHHTTQNPTWLLIQDTKRSLSVDDREEEHEEIIENGQARPLQRVSRSRRRARNRSPKDIRRIDSNTTIVGSAPPAGPHMYDHTGHEVQAPHFPSTREMVQQAPSFRKSSGYLPASMSTAGFTPNTAPPPRSNGLEGPVSRRGSVSGYDDHRRKKP